ncbi:hypothetical protein LSH36_308g02019 [Paralvinella palmiformis]|uniref:UDP-glycosyltransferase n=1 Tax=Paralvinella palmiformis TaxID=53620 RepID=A0AAD9JI20_9ANNE|nr:hypothetical protein LSH36_308g02019 [Paralvinella palmiformis]
MREAKQLPRNHPSLEGSNATRDGIIIMSLDQNIALPARIVTTILTSFKIFHTYHVIWQYGGDMTDETIPANVRIMPYVPLNDLVGHPKTRLLVTSADNYHQNLALYHSLPILCIPLQPVQRQNARKTDRRQHGLVIPPENLTIKTFVQAMKKLLFNDTYCRRLEQPSRMMKMKQPASQRSMVEWIELSLANNFDVLKPYAVHMPWARYAMMDIALLVAIVFGNAIFLVANSILLGMRRVWDIYGRRRLPGMGQSVNRLVKPVLPSTTVTPIMKIPGSQLSPTTTLTATKSFKQQ